MSMKQNMLKFYGKDGNTYYVKERTLKQITNVLKSYLNNPCWWVKYEYIPGSQKISKMNGNIYARFYIKGTDNITTLCIADYSDYIGEINFNE